MLYIDIDNKPIYDGLSAHYKWAKCFIRKKVGSAPCADSCNICTSRIKKIEGVLPKLKAMIEDDAILYNMICGMPKVLQTDEEKIMASLLSIPTERRIMLAKDKREDLDEKDKEDRQKVRDYNKMILDIFNYDYFIDLGPHREYSSYNLALSHNRDSCTYCNRNYTSTMVARDGGKLMRPQFDHWFPKSIRPLLALSFYNLVPSCGTCNSSVKGGINLNLDDHVHPYVDRDQVNDLQFTYEFYKCIDRIRIKVDSLNSDGRAYNTSQAFKLEQMFDAHHSELADMLILKRAYPTSYLEQMRAFLPGGLNDTEVYRIIFGTEASPEDFHRRPLSKFKSDILKELKIADLGS